MTKSRQSPPLSDDIDIAALGRALWRAKAWIFALAIGAGVITFIALSMMRPLYTSESRILIQNDESAFTRPTSEQGRESQRSVLDEQAVQSQVQVLTSRDLAMQVIRGLDLTQNEQFAKDGGMGMVGRLLYRIGVGRGSQQSEEEKAANVFARHLSVFQLGRSSVVAVEYTSGDSPLAANIANKLADAYIAWQREAKLEQTKDATAWLSSQIEVLRQRVAESEKAAENFRNSQGLFAGTNNVTLNAQQLSELNSQIILAKAHASEAEARARRIKTMLATNVDIDGTSEVLKSQLVSRLIEQRVQVQRQLAELSATLLPSHPRMRQLSAELADVRKQIRDEVDKVAQGLENEAQVASAREISLRNSLNDVKTQASGLSEAEIRLRALEREAKANRDLLESYLARYRDASAHHDMGAVPAQATIVSRAHASILPSFPKKVPITLLVVAATALLALAYVLARELIGAPAAASFVEPARGREQRIRTRAAAPGPVAPPASPPRKEMPAPPPAASPPRKEPPALDPVATTVMASAAAAETAPAPVKEIAMVPHAQAAPAEASKPKPEPAVPAVIALPATLPPVAPPVEIEERRPAPDKALAEAPLPRPSWPREEIGQRPEGAKPQRDPLAPEPVKEGPSAGELSAAAGLLDRLRRGSAPTPSEPAADKAPPAPGLFDRLRQALPGGKARATATDTAASASLPAARNERPPLRANELRHYLNQRIAASAAESGKEAGNGTVSAPKNGSGKIGPALKSLDAVVNHVLSLGQGSSPRALLVAGVTRHIDSTREAIEIGRALVANRERVILVDVTRGPSAVSGRLGLPRAPGFTDLITGRASFDDVVRIDDESPLQVIAAGNPTVKGDGDDADRFMRMFEALTQVYDCVVLHADPETVGRLKPALKFELPAVVAILPAGSEAGSEADELADFSTLGCPVIVYEQSVEPRAGLLGRAAAI